MTLSRIFLYLCLFFIVGIFLGSLFFSQLLMLGFLILGFLLISVLWKYRNLRIIGFGFLVLVFGIWRYSWAENRFYKSKILNYTNSEQKAIIEGTITEEPDVKEKITRLTIEVTDIEAREPKMAENSSRPFLGKVLVTTTKYPEYKYGHKLRIEGVLKTPSEDLNGFNYRNYLKKEGIVAVMEWPKIELIERGRNNSLKAVLISFKNRFQEAVRSFIPPPQEGILESLVFGEEDNISSEWKEKLNITGTRHIAAVSGMNITIISFLILGLFLHLGLWRQQAFYLSVFVIFIYVLMVGAPASAVRAGIMGIFLMTAQYLGRISAGLRAVIFAAFLILFFNPFLLVFDIGFQLSFLAILGMIYLQPVFFQILKKIPDFKIFPIKSVFSATLSAQFFTLPILIYNFGQISPVSPLINILIVPFLAPITILAFIFGVLAIIVRPLGYIISFVVWFSLSYITGIVGWFAKFPFTSFEIKNLHWIWLIIFYTPLVFFIQRWQEKQRLKFLSY